MFRVLVIRHIATFLGAFAYAFRAVLLRTRPAVQFGLAADRQRRAECAGNYWPRNDDAGEGASDAHCWFG